MEKIGMDYHITTEDRRVGTGIEGLDGVIQGGYPQGSVTLVAGTPGTGKTIVCFQYINAGIKNGEKCLFLTSDERINNLVNQAKKFGFDFDAAIQNGQLKFMYLDLEKHTIHKEMESEIRIGKYSRVVLDSLTPLSEMPVWVVNRGSEIIPPENTVGNAPVPLDSIQATRMHVRRILRILEEDESTALVTSEIAEGSRNLSRDSVSEFLVDGILVLDLDPSMDRRKLTVRKMRGTKHTLKPRDIEIRSTDGIRIL
ncbi:MAG TPA: ATPase domain-containing protein [Candidatus Thermoplasmatota archaeon]|nr:ATPase domain-containing protein [Candidatus Thermoplasmatota archaeon]